MNISKEKTSHKKRRPLQHIMESDSLGLIKESLPAEWVIRDYKPDYGLDLAVECFEYVNGQPNMAETLGEHFFAQVKAIHSTEIKTIKVYARYNVEKSALRNNEEEMLEIEVIKFPIDTSLLLTVQSMGSGIPVILFVVSLDLKKVFFVCLNDLIDKVIVPEDPNFYEKESKVINVPVKNEVSRLHEHLVGIKFYAKRIKFYSAFMKFIYQEKELHYLDWNDRDSVLMTLRHFIAVISRFDIWDTEQWRIMQMYYYRILELEQGLETEDFELLYHKVIPLWEGLTVLSRNYEEMCREWFLPTYLAQLTSYPE